jgi:hypothetical protein
MYGAQLSRLGLPKVAANEQWQINLLESGTAHKKHKIEVHVEIPAMWYVHKHVYMHVRCTK